MPVHCRPAHCKQVKQYDFVAALPFRLLNFGQNVTTYLPTSIDGAKSQNKRGCKGNPFFFCSKGCAAFSFCNTGKRNNIADLRSRRLLCKNLCRKHRQGQIKYTAIRNISKRVARRAAAPGGALRSREGKILSAKRPLRAFCFIFSPFALQY